MLSEDEIQIQGKRYQKCGNIGEGGAGRVFLGIHKNQKYAIKMIQSYKDSYMRKIIDQEIQTQSSFKGHKNIIQIYGSQYYQSYVRQKNRRMFIVFELGERSLRAKIDSIHIIENQYLSMLTDVATGLMAIHQKNMIHRDIKPENIILVDKMYKITDFGIISQETQCQDLVGTVLYWPPQILFSEVGEEKYTQKFDVWSFGVVAFETYFNIHPFFYQNTQNQHSQVKVRKELKENISALTPNFTINKFISHLLKKGKYQKAMSIQGKIKKTNKALLDTFEQFFKPQADRPQIEYFLGIYRSLESQIHGKIIPVTKILNKDIPFDMKFFVNTKDMFFQVNERISYVQGVQVQYLLELALWFLNGFNYGNAKYIQYVYSDRLAKYQQCRAKLWQNVKQGLFQYWTYLKSNEEVNFYENLNHFQFQILLCGCWNLVIQDSHKFIDFVRRVSEFDDIKTLQDIVQYINVMELPQLTKIQDFIMSRYY